MSKKIHRQGKKKRESPHRPLWGIWEVPDSRVAGDLVESETNLLGPKTKKHTYCQCINHAKMDSLELEHLKSLTVVWYTHLLHSILPYFIQYTPQLISSLLWSSPRRGASDHCPVILVTWKICATPANAPYHSKVLKEKTCPVHSKNSNKSGRTSRPTEIHILHPDSTLFPKAHIRYYTQSKKNNSVGFRSTRGQNCGGRAAASSNIQYGSGT